jgi:hypothetical protein
MGQMHFKSNKDRDNDELNNRLEEKLQQQTQPPLYPIPAIKLHIQLPEPRVSLGHSQSALAHHR